MSVIIKEYTLLKDTEAELFDYLVDEAEKSENFKKTDNRFVPEMILSDFPEYLKNYEVFLFKDKKHLMNEKENLKTYLNASLIFFIEKYPDEVKAKIIAPIFWDSERKLENKTLFFEEEITDNEYERLKKEKKEIIDDLYIFIQKNFKELHKEALKVVRKAEINITIDFSINDLISNNLNQAPKPKRK